MKKIISIILAIALLAVPFCSVNVFAEETSVDEYIGTELIKNGGFDEALGTDWTIAWGKPTIVEATSDYAGDKAGDNCVAIPNNAGGIVQSGINLSGGYRYTLSFMIASRDATLGKKLIDVSLGNASGTLFNETYTSVNFNYEKVSYTFTCEEDITVDLWFNRMNYAGASDISIDDVSIKATATLGEEDYIGTELVKDGGFDAALTDNWAVFWGGSAIVPATSDYAGDKADDNCVAIPNNAGGIVQYGINLRGGYRYTLSFMIASRDATLGKKLIDVSLGNASGTLFNETYTSVNFNYEKVSYTFTCEEDITVDLWFNRANYAGASAISIDDVSIKATSTIDEYYSKYLVNELVTNGDFADGYTGWTAANIGPKESPDGGIEMRIWWGEAGSIATNINVEAGKTYDVSFTYRKGKTAPLTYSAIQNGETIFEDAIASEISQNVHTKVSYKFTAKADGTVEIKFASQPNDSITAISNVSVVPAVSAEYVNLVSDSTLEDPINNGWSIHNSWGTNAYQNTETDGIGTAGNNMIKFNPWGSLAFTSINVVEGQTYKLSFDWAPSKNTEAISKMSFYICEGEYDGSNFILNDVETSQYRHMFYNVERTFTSTFTGKATLRFGSASGDNGHATFIDNVCVYPAVYENAVVNGTFETAVAPAGSLNAFAAADNYYGWCLDGAAEISDVAANGSKSLKVANTDGAYAYVNIANPENSLAFNYKGEADSSAKVIVSSDFAGEDVLATKEVIGTGEWQEFVIPTDLAVGKVYIHIVSEQGTNYFDDVSIISYDLSADKDFAPKSDEDYIYDVSGADIKAGYEAMNADLTVSSDEMATGIKVALKINGKFTAWEKEIVVEGDANGDGVSNVRDLVAAKKQSAGMDRLSGAYLRAVTANENGEVQGCDLTALRNIILK